MRRTVLLFLVAAFGAACSSAPPPPPYKPVADVKQLMASIMDPSADEYWEAVGTIIDEHGITEITPSTVEEWDNVRNHALIVAEAGNLLMMSSRAKDGGDWMKLSRSLVDVAEKAMHAAESHNRNAVFDAGAELYDVCTACHVKYALEIQQKAQQTKPQ